MMNNRAHLPAGQPMQGGAADMGPGSGSGGRRGGRPHQPYPNSAHHYHHSVSQPVYPPGYMTPYGAAPPYYIPPHYQNGAMAAPAYLPYPPPATYSRSPPSMQHYAPMVAQSPYSRPPQSPIVPQPYQPPPPSGHVPIPPHTPSSTHSQAGPPPMTPPVTQVRGPPPVPADASAEIREPQPRSAADTGETQESQPAQQTPPSPTEPEPSSVSPAVIRTKPFRPPVPWFSVPNSPFPSRPPRPRRRKRPLDPNVHVERRELQQIPPSEHRVPSSLDGTTTSTSDILTPESVASSVTLDHLEEEKETAQEQASSATPKAASQAATSEPPRSETPSTQDQDAPSTSPTTPSSVQPSQQTTGASITVAPNPVKSATRSAVPAVPAIPVVPALPKTSPKEAKPASSRKTQVDTKPAESVAAAESTETTRVNTEPTENAAAGQTEKQEASAEPSPQTPAPAPAKVKLWTGLFAKTASAGGGVTAATASQGQVNGTVTSGSNAAADAVGGFAQSNASSTAEALKAYRVDGAEKLAFLEPRGLVNTGNICYMNSVLQVLISCIPFYNFLDQVSKKAAHSFKSETPLLDAMIMFMREFKVIDSAVSVDQLRRRLRSEELEQYGDAFTPEFVYDAIRKLPRFASMERGHQQDAQEFLGFLLEGLHDECAHIMRAAPASTASTAPSSSLPSPTASSKTPNENDWLEVGPRQRPAITRASGHSAVSSPVTRIFGGQLRSELRVPGMKNSVTLEPYQSLPLDIGAPEIRNIVDALQAITRPETLVGDWDTPFGPGTKATKQVFIDPPPPILILHLKRFQYEGSGTVKIYKKVGYPLELEIPSSVLSRHKRNELLSKGTGLPRYRLTAVVYHHGRNASGGHYTVDVRRQDGQEWIRIDDTSIKRVRNEDVAEGGAEDEPKTNQADSRKETSNSAAGNRFASIDGENTGDDDGWKQAPSGNKKWSSVANGASTPPSGGAKAKGQQQPVSQQPRTSVKDNKVAYLLFYQRI